MITLLARGSRFSRRERMEVYLVSLTLGGHGPFDRGRIVWSWGRHWCSSGLAAGRPRRLAAVDRSAPRQGLCPHEQVIQGATLQGHDSPRRRPLHRERTVHVRQPGVTEASRGANIFCRRRRRRRMKTDPGSSHLEARIFRRRLLRSQHALRSSSRFQPRSCRGNSTALQSNGRSHNKSRYTTTVRISLSNVLKNYRKSSEQSKRSSCSLSSSIVSLRIVRQKKKKKKRARWFFFSRVWRLMRER